MPYRPKLSDEIEELVIDWMDKNSDLGISEKNKAIEHLIKKALDENDESMTEEAVREIVRQELEQET